MKLSRYIWNLYKESPKGKAVIDSFKIEDVPDSFYGLRIQEHIRLYNPAVCKDIKQFEYVMETLFCYNISEHDMPKTIEDARELHIDAVSYGIFDSGEYVVNVGEFDFMLRLTAPISYALYCYSPKFFFPYLLQYNFFHLNRIADYFEIELPPIPKKSDYKARCMYYMDLCETFYHFRKEYGLSPMELCAFIYDFADKMIPKKEYEMPEPAQAWFIGGRKSPAEKDGDINFWQANQETKKGDILIMYETSPISAITTIWRAQTDGVIDPFFHYYSNCYISNEINIPHITLKDLQNHPYFSKHSLIRKKFQGVNGWPISSTDYSELLRMISDRGGDVAKLPKLYAPAFDNNTHIENERDVEQKLLEPLLMEIGLSLNDYIRQLPIHAGRGSRIYPDYALFYDKTPGYEKAKILIEAKYNMKNNKDIEDSFKQARSYANILESEVIIICDMNFLIVYERNNGFDRNNYTKYFWKELENPDKFNNIKNKILP
jgi:hypothetical protein